MGRSHSPEVLDSGRGADVEVTTGARHLAPVSLQHRSGLVRARLLEADRGRLASPSRTSALITLLTTPGSRRYPLAGTALQFRGLREPQTHARGESSSGVSILLPLVRRVITSQCQPVETEARLTEPSLKEV